jgi:hypothetical protein
MPSMTKLRSIKDQLREAIDLLPENCTADDAHYQIYLIEKIRRGEQALKNTGGIAHIEVRKRAAAWAKK